MQKQSLDFAISTADLVSGLDLPAPEPKLTARDLFTISTQVGGALSLCWILHTLA